jgi:carbamoyl-phosphate synthase large subunit
MKKYNAILVTGCGGDIGTGLARILKASDVAKTIIGADINPNNAGEFLFDICEALPRTDNPRYFDGVQALIKKYGIDVIIPMSEAEIRLWYKSGYTERFEGVPVVMANKEVFDVAIDKLATADFLKSHQLPYPWTMLVADGSPREFPCIVKSRGTGDKGGVEVVDESSVAYFSTRRQGNIWQEYLEGDEYTAGVYGCASGEIRSVVLKRNLSGGMTGYTMGGEVVDEPEIMRVLERVAKGVALRGSMNVQLRLAAKGPVVFEINPRFSSTVVFRHKLGFKDLMWSLEEKASEPASAYLPPTAGTKFYKGYTEYIEGKPIEK